MSSTNHVGLRSVTEQSGSQGTVNQVDLVLKAGESVDMAEHSDAGKSTIMELILGPITPTEGEVALLGELTSSRARTQCRSQIGYPSEVVVLHPSLTGIETMNSYVKFGKQPLSKNRELLKCVGISQTARHRAGIYSKGMCQHLALARALLGEPKVLLFDESITGLDPALCQMFYEVVHELNGRSTAVLFSTHALAELDGRVDRIIVMKNGVKVADGSMDELHVQSNLSLTINVRLGEARPLSERRHPLSGGLSYQAQCKAEERVVLLSESGDLGSLVCIDIHAPTLNDMYVRFLKREDV